MRIKIRQKLVSIRLFDSRLVTRSRHWRKSHGRDEIFHGRARKGRNTVDDMSLQRVAATDNVHFLCYRSCDKLLLLVCDTLQLIIASCLRDNFSGNLFVYQEIYFNVDVLKMKIIYVAFFSAISSQDIWTLFTLCVWRLLGALCLPVLSSKILLSSNSKASVSFCNYLFLNCKEGDE